MPPLPSQTDILIVGAGPTGLALAAELTRLGRQPLIYASGAAVRNALAPLRDILAEPTGDRPRG